MSKEYYLDDYVYLVDGDGKDADFKGFSGSLNSKTAAPYKVCTKHTEETWKKYEATLPEETKPEDSGSTATTTPPKENGD